MTSNASVQRILFDSVTKAIPRLFAVAMFTAGALLLIAVLTPIDPAAMPVVRRWLPLQVVEISHVAGTVIGVLMLFLARGLWERIDTAWYLAISLFCLGAVFSLTRELAVVPAVLLGLCALLLMPCKGAFNRRSQLMSLSVNPMWAGATLVTLMMIVWLGFYVYSHIPYAHSMWIDFGYHASVTRFLRGLVVMGATVVLVGLYRLFGIANRIPPMPDDEDMDQVREVLATTSNPQAWLALLRDKHILWNEARTAFLMYGIAGKQWVVMGEPVGEPSAAEPLFWTLQEMASLRNARLSVYQVGPKLLPLMIDLGLRPFKIGEEALVDVAGFDLAGKKGYGFRQTLKRFEGLQAEFVVIAPDAVDAHMPELKAVSDAWLKSKNAKEKRYSLGCFKPEYMRLTPVAVVRLNGRIMAFANLWPTQDKAVLTLDLMRYDPASPPSIMEYLFLQLIAWARDNGYAQFSLGLAPLAGLEAKPLSSAWHKIASVIYQLGGEVYNFQGLRAYKEKFRPHWEPRYFAIKGQETALGAALMAVVALGARQPKAHDETEAEAA
ncbi:MAG: bifunctional lysylphosphatidylglycerol flippase/synthetase MprF [Asticcacaulis sp.]|nr:bifunctional lysylphosphatidylglycerol flippase/synthetase MprF [Asticcacaulis sp.]